MRLAAARSRHLPRRERPRPCCPAAGCMLYRGCHSMLICYPERREGSQAALPVRRTRCRARASAAMPCVVRRSRTLAIILHVGRHFVLFCHPARRVPDRVCPAAGCVAVLMRRSPCRVSVVVPRVGRRAHASAAPCLCVGRHSVPSRHPARREGPSVVLSCRILSPGVCRAAHRSSCPCVGRHSAPSRHPARRDCPQPCRDLPPGVCRAMCRPPCSCVGRRARASAVVSMRRLPFRVFLSSGAPRRASAVSSDHRVRCRAHASPAVPCVGRRAARRSPCPCVGCPVPVRRPPFRAFSSSGAP